MPVIANAFTGKVEIDGIYYNLVTKANMAEVTYGDAPYTVSAISSPAQIEYEGIICDVTSIGEEAFKDCIELTSVSVPSSVTVIGNMAFFGCENMVSVLGLDNVTNIGSYAFANCMSMVSFMTIYIINGVEMKLIMQSVLILI